MTTAMKTKGSKKTAPSMSIATGAEAEEIKACAELAADVVKGVIDNARSTDDSAYWQAKLTALNKSYGESVVNLKGARRKKYEQIGLWVQTITTYLTATDKEQEAFRAAVRASLSAINKMPKSDKSVNWQYLFLKSVVFGGEKDEKKLEAYSKQLSVYFAVVRRAFELKKTPTEIPDWIESENGIERIRLGATKSQSGHTYKQKVDKAKQALSVASRPKTVVEPDADLGLTHAHDGQVVVLVATYRDGVLQLRHATTDSNVVNVACAAYQAHADATNKAAPQQSAVDSVIAST